MLFNSLDFAVFFSLTLAVALALPHRAQNAFLLLASYVFYAAWDFLFLGLIVVSTLVDFTVGQALKRSTDARRRKLLLATSL